MLEVGNPAIVAAINRRVYCEIQTNSSLSVELHDFMIETGAKFEQQSLEWTTPMPAERMQKLIFAQKAIECSLKYLPRFNTFKLRTWGDSASLQGQKMGFGTSAAAVVAIVAAILKYHGIDISTDKGKDIIFKLACIAHFQAQGNIGSGFDVAASTWGGIIVYKRFDPKWLVSQLKDIAQFPEIIHKAWPRLLIERLQPPPDFHLLVGWTKSPASTVKMVDQVSKFPGRISIYNQIGSLVNKLISAWKAGEQLEILALIRQDESLLGELGAKSGAAIETPALRTLADMANQLGAAGKLSGAGGGDCGIAIYFDTNITQLLRNAWQSKGIQIVDIEIDQQGSG